MPPPLPSLQELRQMEPWRTANLFTPAEVQCAFATLHRSAEALYGHSETSTLLRPFVHRRGGAGGYRRDHIEIPLHYMYENNAVYQQFPVELQVPCSGLHQAALDYAQKALQEPCVSSIARDGILHNLGRKSVLRVLRYPAGSGCRPHVDPGLCTALLVGSAGGLEVSTTGLVLAPFVNRPGGHTGPVTSLPTLTHLEESNTPGTLPHWEPVLTAHAGKAIVMAGNILEAVSGGAMPGVWHRVHHSWHSYGSRADGQCSSCTHAASTASGTEADTSNGSVPFRFNVIVELRPAEAKRWYAAVSQRPPLSCVSAAPSVS
ncbi:hypothetical protein LSCM1_06976 [Leishmania martiniquensis]|uniref:Fe2OG dioxygenase domain-containing protein n=1 Tax=Leishmania martiniquensis TaxID=1580590 RepID=A0A836GJ33_9TRYP|nr:hypothetical protein LSCM1_06976 [Leishmania martiniquensis]